MLPLLSILLALPLLADEAQLWQISARASEIDKRAREHPEIDFVFGTKEKPQDLQHAAVDTRVESRGRLMIWLMGHKPDLFRETAGYGLHSIQIHYARGWFSQLYGTNPLPPDDLFLSKIRLEAATGIDCSAAVTIPKPDGMMERAYQFVKHLQKENPEGNWAQFFSENGAGLNWEKVIISGASHGSTTAARFAKYQRVARVVMFCGPRDQFETWQSMPSATPAERFFAFSHILDGGWTGGHYPRSWQLLGLHQFGPIVNVDITKPPYFQTRRLTTAANVAGSIKQAHACVTPGNKSPKNKNGIYKFKDVWHYLYTHPVIEVGEAVPVNPRIELNLRH